MSGTHAASPYGRAFAKEGPATERIAGLVSGGHAPTLTLIGIDS